MFAKRHFPTLFGVCLLGSLLLAPQCRDSLWLDEQHTAWTIRDGFASIAERARLGNNSPAYFYLPWASTRIWGWNEFAIRLPSLVAGLLTVVSIYAIVVWVTSEPIPAAAASLALLLDPHHLYFTLEARVYAWVTLVGCWQITSFAVAAAPLVAGGRGGAEGRGMGSREVRIGRWAWVLCSVAMVHLHYTSILVLLVEGLMLAVAALSRGRRDDLLPWLVPCLVLSLACLPAANHALAILQVRDQWYQFISPPHLVDLVWVFPGMLLAAAGWTAAAISQAMEVKESTGRRPVGREGASWAVPFAISVVFVATLATAWLAHRLGFAPLFFRRYLMAVATCGFLVAGLLVAFLSPAKRRIIGSIVVCVAAIVGSGTVGRWRIEGKPIARANEDWRGVARYLNDCSPRPVAIQSGMIEAERLGDPQHSAGSLFRDYCSLPLLGLYPPPAWALPIHPLPRNGLRSYFATTGLANVDSFWLVVRDSPDSRRGRPELGSRWKIELSESFGRIRVFLVTKDR